MTMKIFNKYTVRESEMYGINKKINTVWEKKILVHWKFNYIYHWKRSLSKILTSKNKLRGGDLYYKCVVAKMRINPKNNGNQIRISRKIRTGLVDCNSITLYYKSCSKFEYSLLNYAALVPLCLTCFRGMSVLIVPRITCAPNLRTIFTHLARFICVP